MKRKSVTLLLTTHFLPICKNLEGNKRLLNYRMMVNQKKNNELIYLYTMEKGISGVKGCYSVLKGLNYPAEILMNAIRSVKQ
jgi:DNA mismatch repair ATPase MutS